MRMVQSGYTNTKQRNKMTQKYKKEVIDALTKMGLEVFQTQHRAGKVYKTKFYKLNTEINLEEQLRELADQFDVAFVFIVYTDAEGKSSEDCTALNNGYIMGDPTLLNVVMDLQ